MFALANASLAPWLHAEGLQMRRELRVSRLQHKYFNSAWLEEHKLDPNLAVEPLLDPSIGSQFGQNPNFRGLPNHQKVSNLSQ
jgi:hypothetical protein